jgi:Tn7-like transposition protein D/TniQ
MLGTFPDPYPDELLYSVFARFSARVRYPAEQSVLKDLFGTIHVAASVHFPGHLEYLTAALPAATGYTSDYLIDNHTCLPFFEPFLTKGRVRQVREQMYKTGHSIYVLLGIVGSHIPQPRWLRLCPQCIVEDRQHYGECYWHRVHQVPGVEVCPIHQDALSPSPIRACNSLARPLFVSAEHTVRSLTLHPFEAAPAHHQHLLPIAQDIQWLLSERMGPFDLQTLHQLYLKQLVVLGFASHQSKQVDMKGLVRAFKSFYPPELLKSFSCELDETVKRDWVGRLLKEQRHQYHPLRHLLLIHFLGYTAEAFFALDPEEKPFGDGPWPCLNPASDHYLEKRIQEYHVSSVKSVKKRPPVATFSCSCGFVYSRSGPDTSEKERFRCEKILSFGSLWETRLRQLWEDPTVSFERIVTDLKSTHFLVKRQVARLGLASASQTQRQITLGPKHQPTQPMTWVVDQARREDAREKWLRMMQEHPDMRRAELGNEGLRIYQWLRRNDLEWLNEKLATRKKVHKNGTRMVDWEKRDRQIVEQVKHSISQMRNAHPPKKITITAIAKAIHFTGLSGKLQNCPLTAEVLAEHLDTNESYALRRIEWIVELYRKEQVCPGKWQFIQRAGLLKRLDGPKVKEALDLALLKLKTN